MSPAVFVPLIYSTQIVSLRFSWQPPLTVSVSTTHQRAGPLFYSRRNLFGKSFQLEEREDRDAECTEIWLREDGSVHIGATDGPPMKAAYGSWNVNEDFKGNVKGENAFSMTLVRTYEGGEHTGKNQPGNFVYDVQRDFIGDIDTTGEYISVSGKIHGRDAGTNADCEVGYFSMIDEAAEAITEEAEEATA